MSRLPWREAAITALLLALCWPAWWGTGWLLEAAGLEALGLAARLPLLVLALCAAEAALARLAPAAPH